MSASEISADMNAPVASGGMSSEMIAGTGGIAGMDAVGIGMPRAVQLDELIAAITLQQTTPLTTTRVITYTYDGLQRLTGADENSASPTDYSYSYDLAGNRTGVWTNGTQTQNYSYNAANQVIGWSYDAAGNLLSDGTTTRSWDALGRMLTSGSTSYAYNGDGVLVAQTTSSVTTRYTQDLASPLSQILSDGTNRYIYGHERLFGQASSTRTWYTSDALGSVRQTLNNSGRVLGNTNYDPWGTPQGSAVAPFGFTGELQQGGSVYLRARWYTPGSGALLGRDPFGGYEKQPYSLMPYQYGYNRPLNYTDPSGRNPAVCLAFVVVDGPIPAGDVVALGCAVYYGGLALGAWGALNPPLLHTGNMDPPPG